MHPPPRNPLRHNKPRRYQAKPAWESPELVPFGAGRLEALSGAAEVRPCGRHRGRPAVSSFAVGSAVMQASGSGDDPVGAGVIEPEGDQAAQVDRGGTVV
jgi:hypothetical protein